MFAALQVQKLVVERDGNADADADAAAAAAAALTAGRWGNMPARLLGPDSVAGGAHVVVVVAVGGGGGDGDGGCDSTARSPRSLAGPSFLHAGLGNSANLAFASKLSSVPEEARENGASGAGAMGTRSCRFLSPRPGLVFCYPANGSRAVLCCQSVGRSQVAMLIAVEGQRANGHWNERKWARYAPVAAVLLDPWYDMCRPIPRLGPENSCARIYKHAHFRRRY